MKPSLVQSSELSDQEDIRVGTHAQVGLKGSSSVVRLVVQWVAGTILVFLLGSWLVWWAISLQGQFAEDEIRGACQRVMPETVQRCVDTVIIQRGGARR